jgi:LuxR family transcriptional regulator, maltose regulon positive regulatory protein
MRDPGAVYLGARLLRTDRSAPLAEAKLALPATRGFMVERSRIDRVLDAGREASLTLVAAPAGYGKTTAVREWCARRRTPTAWVALDEDDNDPAGLWTYVAAAVDRAVPGAGRAALSRLTATAARIKPAIDVLANELSSSGRELAIVLDDLQRVTDVACLESIDYALERLAGRAQLIVITRTDPALRLARLRAGDALTELRARDLAFTAAETRELLVERAGVGLDAAHVELLRARTEGWPAALVLAGVWLRRERDPGQAARRFGGDHRFVVDYLSREALGALDDDARWFLLRASVLGRFTAALCDEVLGRSDSARILAELERSMLLITRLEHGGWYRVHPLFAEFARLQLAAEAPQAEREMHRRAAAWLRPHGRVLEAAEHARAAGDFDVVAETLTEHHLSLVAGGRARALLRCLDALPDEQFVVHPELAVGSAIAATILGRAFDRRRFLHLADQARTERPERFTPSVEALAASVRAGAVDGDVGRAVLEGRRAVEIAEAEAGEVLPTALSGYARALYLAGAIEDAREVALRALDHPDAGRRLTYHVFTRTTLALVAADRGRAGSARIHAEKAKELVIAAGVSRSWLGANVSAALGGAFAAGGRLADAEHELGHAERFFREEVASVHHVWLLALLARVRVGRGRLHEAEAALESARSELAELRDGGQVPELVETVARELCSAKRRASDNELVEAPSRAELAVLRLLASDRSVRQIGEELFLSFNTVRSHTRSIYRKLGVNTRAEAVARAEALGLLEPAPAEERTSA